MALPVFKTGLAAIAVAGGFDSLPPPPPRFNRFSSRLLSLIEGAREPIWQSPDPDTETLTKASGFPHVLAPAYARTTSMNRWIMRASVVSAPTV